MKYTAVIGSFAAFLTTMSFLPQVVKAYKTKQTKDLSLGMLVIFASGLTLWTVYGVLLKEVPIIAANIITLIFVVYILLVKLRFG